MGMADRDYQRREYGSDGNGAFSQLTPVVKWLLILNVSIYLLDLFFEQPPGVRPMREFGAFTITSALYHLHIWEFLTFQFIHASLGHVLFNSLGIFFFGPWLERWWGSQRFILFYLLCGVGGACFYTLLVMLHVLPSSHFESGLVGASAGIYGILIGAAVIAPELRVQLLFPPITLTMRQMAIGLMVISAGSIILKLGGNEGGEAGHLGGAILGYFLVRYPHIIGSHLGVDIIKPKLFRRKTPAKPQTRSSLEHEQDRQVDLILDKISKDGFQSLTQAERDFLTHVSNSKRSSS
jgi:membrane associated rhomboid family serine protease